VIDPVAFAAALTDIASEITNSADRQGRGAMLAILQMGGFRISGLGAPVATTDAARLGDLMGYLPAGAIVEFSFKTVPAGYLLADGSTFSRVAYPALNTAYANDGYPWGAGDGLTTANLPNYGEVVRRGWLASSRGFDPGRAWGSTQNDAHTHTDAGHTHGITQIAHSHGGISGGGGTTGGANASITINTGNASINAIAVDTNNWRNVTSLVCVRAY
jgi:hypothetical protein